MTNAKNSAAKKLVEDATEAGLVTEEKTVPAQAEPTGEKVTAERDTDGKLHILVSDEDAEEPTKLKKLLGKVKQNKKALIAGGVAVAAILLGVSVQKKRSTTDEESEAEADEPADEA